MDFQELIEKRYSVRAYKSDPVPEEMLEKVLFELQMNYVDETRRPQDAPEGETTDDDTASDGSDATSEETTDPEK